MAENRDRFVRVKTEHIRIVSLSITTLVSNRTTADDVIVHTKSIFARHGITEIVVSDNGPQYSSEAFAKFTHEYQFEHVTSSPYHPQSNREAKRAVQTVKRLLKKEGDPYLALLSY